MTRLYAGTDLNISISEACLRRERAPHGSSETQIPSCRTASSFLLREVFFSPSLWLVSDRLRRRPRNNSLKSLRPRISRQICVTNANSERRSERLGGHRQSNVIGSGIRKVFTVNIPMQPAARTWKMSGSEAHITVSRISGGRLGNPAMTESA